MKFVSTDKLKPGMRLAKPIYNRNGVLLYDRNSKLTLPGITSVRNFGLIGVYILEPAEPVPPLSREDIEFEQLQTIYMFQLREISDLIFAGKKIEQLPLLLDDILKNYGSLDHRVNFNQNLRSAEDSMYKHALSTAILTAMITGHMEYTHEQQLILVCSALLFDIGLHYAPKMILGKGADLTQSDRDIIQQNLEKGLETLSRYQNEFPFFAKVLTLVTAYIYSFNPQKALTPDASLLTMMQVLKIADKFDRMTAMTQGHAPESEIKAMQHLMDNPHKYPPELVAKLAESIHIVPHAASVDLSTGDKGIVLIENPNDFMHPVILRLSNNEIYDLSLPRIARNIQIVDIMKTMDNRIEINKDTLKQFVPDERLKELTADFQKRLILGNLRKEKRDKERALIENAR